jgi:hypothetical protein
MRAMNEATLKAKVEGRHSARELFDFLDWSEHEGHGADFADGFIEMRCEICYRSGVSSKHRRSSYRISG